MNSRIIKESMILFVITLISGLLLGVVYDITKEPIKAQEEKAKQAAYMVVFEDADEFTEDPLASIEDAKEVLEQEGITSSEIVEVVAAKDGQGETIGYVMSVVNSEGYGGDIKLSIGIRMDGTVNGYEILSINETAGLGMKAKDDFFKDQFKDKQVEQFVVTKTGASQENEIDALSGATITSNAVTNGVNAGITYFTSLVGGGQNE